MNNKKILLISLVIATILMISMFSAIKITTRADEPPTTDPPPTEPPTESPPNELPDYPRRNWTFPKHGEKPSYYPKRIPLTKDADGNRVSDVLDEMILEANESDTLSTVIPVHFWCLDMEPITTDDVAYFEEFGGRDLTSGVGDHVLYGKIAMQDVCNFVASDEHLAFIEPEFPFEDYSTGYGAHAESMPTNCDYEHVAMLFGAREQEGLMYYPWDLLAPLYYIEYKYSIYGLQFDPVYNLVENPSHPTLKSEVIDMRDISQAIQNYQKWQST